MATFYWVGGTGTWDGVTTTNWAASSGGAGGAGVPTSTDNVIFDGSSNVGTGAFTVTTSGSPACNNFTASGLDGAMTLTVSAALSIYGNFTAQATNFSVTSGTVAIQFVGSGTQTVTSAGVALTTISINCAGSVVLADAMNIGTRNLSMIAGTFNTSGFAFTGASISQTTTPTAASTLILGASTVTLSGSINVYYSSLFTLNAGTSSVVLSGGSAGINVYLGNGLTFYNVSFTSTSSIAGSLYGGQTGLTFNNLSFASMTTGATVIALSGNITVNGTLTLPTGNSYIWRYIFYSYTGTTINAAAISGTMTDVDFANITVTGPTAPWSGTRLGDGGGNSGISGFAAGTTKYWNLAGGGNLASTAWATSSGGSPAVANFPLPQDSIIFENTGLNTSATVSVGYSYLLGAIDFSTRSNAMTWSANNALMVAGNFKLSSAVTMSGTNPLRVGRAGQTCTITTAGINVTAALETVPGISGTVTFADNYTGGTLSYAGVGAVNMNGKTFSIGTYRKITSGTTAITLGGATITSSGSVNFAAYASFGQITFNGTCTLNMSSASAKSIINGACANMSGFTIVNTGAGAITFSNINYANTAAYGTYGDLQTTVRPETITFTSGQTFGFKAFTISGTAGNLVTLNATTAGSQATLTAPYQTINLSYCSIKDLNFKGGAYWIADTANGNVNSGNNYGISFSGGLGIPAHYTQRKAKVIPGI